MWDEGRERESNKRSKIIRYQGMLMDIVYVVSNESRAVHESGRVDFRPSPDSTCRRQVEGGGTRNQPLALIDRVGSVSGESLDLANIAGILKKFVGICKNSLDLHQKSPKLVWISSNLAGSHQIWSRSHKIFSNLSLILPELAGFVYNIGWVRWLGFWRRKLATRPAGVGSWAWKRVIDRWEHRFGLKSGRDQAGWSVRQV